jgi:hypothetical protein
MHVDDAVFYEGGHACRQKFRDQPFFKIRERIDRALGFILD